MDECIIEKYIFKYINKYINKYAYTMRILVQIRTLTTLLYQRASKLWVYGYLYNLGKLTCLYPVVLSVQGMFLENYEAKKPFELI